MATPFEYQLVELAGVFRSDILNLESLAPDRTLAELRKEGGELASTGVNMRPLSHPQINLYALRITYALRRPLILAIQRTGKRGCAPFYRTFPNVLNTLVRITVHRELT